MKIYHNLEHIETDRGHIFMKKIFESILIICIFILRVPVLHTQSHPVNIILFTEIPFIMDGEINISIFNLRQNYNELIGNEDYFSSVKGQTAIITSYNFFRNFIKNDIPSMKEVLVDPNNERHHFNDETYRLIPNNVLSLIIGRILFYSSNEIGIEYLYSLQYKNNNPNYIIYINMLYIDNEWKINKYGYDRDY